MISMPNLETIAATILVLVTLGVAFAFGLRQYRQLIRYGHAVASEERDFMWRTARRRLLISCMLGLVGLLIGATYLSGLDHSVAAIGDSRGQQPLNPVEKQVVKLFSGSWIAILLLLLGIVAAVGLDLWYVRRHWRQSLQQIRDDRRDMMDRQLARLRAEHREAQIDPELN